MRAAFFTLFIVALLLIVSAPVVASEKRDLNPAKLQSVHKVYVGEMGTTDEAARFRMLLAQELSKKGFIVVDQAQNADAILTGILTVRVYADTSIARATVQLKSANGEILWAGDFQPKRTFKSVSDTVKFRAQNVADALRGDYQKAAKATNAKR
ncbi:MAG: hypothetical protein PHX83_17320 [Acidobacteriia bacterium]|nr:hypothetical protein [Terriglobia bacterium]